MRRSHSLACVLTRLQVNWDTNKLIFHKKQDALDDQIMHQTEVHLRRQSCCGRKGGPFVSACEMVIDLLPCYNDFYLYLKTQHDKTTAQLRSSHKSLTQPRARSRSVKDFGEQPILFTQVWRSSAPKVCQPGVAATSGSDTQLNSGRERSRHDERQETERGTALHHQTA